MRVPANTMASSGDRSQPLIGSRLDYRVEGANKTHAPELKGPFLVFALDLPILPGASPSYHLFNFAIVMQFPPSL